MAKKVLVVDDEESILDAVSLILEEYGYDVLTTPRGEETYKKVKEFKPNVILLDVLMSGEDGREICMNLKNDDKTKKIPVIMISAHPSAARDIEEFGADNFLAKPFKVEDLLKAVGKSYLN